MSLWDDPSYIMRMYIVPVETRGFAHCTTHAIRGMCAVRLSVSRRGSPPEPVGSVGQASDTRHGSLWRTPVRCHHGGIFLLRTTPHGGRFHRGIWLPSREYVPLRHPLDARRVAQPSRPCSSTRSGPDPRFESNQQFLNFLATTCRDAQTGTHVDNGLRCVFQPLRVS